MQKAHFGAVHLNLQKNISLSQKLNDKRFWWDDNQKIFCAGTLEDEGEENLDGSLHRVLERHVDACVQTFVNFDFHLEWEFPFMFSF